MRPQYPLCVSTMCQRLCMGTFSIALIANWLFGMFLPMNVIALITIALLALGMLGTMSHLGKPGRFLNALKNPTSHLTLEMITCIPVGICYLAIGLNGLLYAMPSTVLVILEVVGLLASVLFIWVTARAYRMKARPAWNTVFTPLNFMLEYVSAGCLGTCFFAVLFGGQIPVAFLVMTAVLLAASLAGQLFYTYYVGRVGYRVDVKPFDGESMGFYTAWIVSGFVVPVISLALLFAFPSNVLLGTVLVLSEAFSLVMWQCFFFISGKEVWFFPQYEKNLVPTDWY